MDAVGVKGGMWWLLVSCRWASPAEPPPIPEVPAPSLCAEHANILPTPTDPRLQGPQTLVVQKQQRSLALYRHGKLEQCWTVALAWDAPTGHKTREGDRKTPEGWYRTSDKPWSSYKGAIAVHYPNALDASAGFADGALSKKERDAIVAADKNGTLPPQKTALGGDILIHGGGSSSDWTLGCIALEDADLQALRTALGKLQAADLLVLP